jgi:POTRA domain-containing FtsQ-type protein
VISATVAVFTTLVALTVSYLIFPVTGMEVKGARMFPELEAWEALPNHASLLSLNAGALERQIESNPWVKGSEVLKDWESGIVTVQVEERKAVLNGDLDGRRIVLAADGTELPGLGGASLTRVGLDDEVQLKEISRVGEVLEESGVVLESIDVVDAGGVEATVEGRRVLFAGEVGDGQARALKGLMEEQPEVPYFDLRSPERVVVAAEPGTESVTEPDG